jgi:hypothetical protein
MAAIVSTASICAAPSRQQARRHDHDRGVGCERQPLQAEEVAAEAVGAVLLEQNVEARAVSRL